MSTFLSLTSTNTGCIPVSALASSLGISIGITSSEIGLEICAVAAGIKQYKLMIKKKKKKHEEIVLRAKTKFNSMEVLISKFLSDSVIGHYEICFNL